jgi:pimeloyl-ACP methyl ester carboxylesterase
VHSPGLGIDATGITAALLVPGLGLGPPAWQPTLQSLQRTGFVPNEMVVVPLPGYGLRAARRDDLSPFHLAHHLAENWPSGGDRRLLMGHSASCQVVAHAAALFPDRVGGLVLVGPTTDPWSVTWPRLAARWLATARHEHPGQVPSPVRQYYRTGLYTMFRAMDSARRDRIDLALLRVSCPVLVVRGVHDRIAPRDWVDQLLRQRQAASTDMSVTVPSGGHMVPLTHGDLVAEAVSAFLARLAAEAGR